MRGCSSCRHITVNTNTSLATANRAIEKRMKRQTKKRTQLGGLNYGCAQLPFPPMPRHIAFGDVNVQLGPFLSRFHGISMVRVAFLVFASGFS